MLKSNVHEAESTSVLWKTHSGSNESPLRVSTAVHMIAHLLNVEWYNNSRQGVYDALSTALSNLEDAGNTTYLNPIRITNLVSLSQLIIKKTMQRNKTSSSYVNQGKDRD